MLGNWRFRILRRVVSSPSSFILKKGARQYATTITKASGRPKTDYWFIGRLLIPVGVLWAIPFFFPNDFFPLPKEFHGLILPVTVQEKIYYALRKLGSNGSVTELMEELNAAYSKLLALNYDEISPEATSILLLKTRITYEHSTDLSVQALKDSFQEIIRKPHVGEGVIEETRRLKSSFAFTYNLLKNDNRFNGNAVEIDSFAFELANWTLKAINNPPSYLNHNWAYIRSDVLAENKGLIELCKSIEAEK